MKARDKKYILNNIRRKTAGEIAADLGIKERKVRKFLDRKEPAPGNKKRESPPLLRSGRDIGFLALALLVIAAAGFAVYTNALGADLLWDDHYLVKNNVYIRSFEYVGKIFTENIEPAYRKRFLFYRPLQMFSYLLDYHLWGLNSVGYHLTNILLHIMVAFSLYWLVLLFFKDRLLALAGALVFIVHPVHIEAVTYVSGRADTLAALFMLLSFVYYVKFLDSGVRAHLAALTAAFILAVLSRESALILPALFLLYNMAFRRKPNASAITVTASLAVIYVIFRVFVFRFSLPHTQCPANIFERLPGSLVAVATYVKLIFLPFDLHMEYGTRIFPWSHSLVPAGAAAFLLICVCIAYSRKRNSVIFFSLSWFVITLLPSLNIYPINAYMSEHWLYIPLMGLSMAAGYVFSNLYHSPRFRYPALIGVLFLLSFFGRITVENNRFWQDGITLYERTLKYAPDRSVLYNNLGILYADRNDSETGDREKAVQMFKTAISVDPTYVYAYNNLGKIYNLMGKKDEAMRYYKKSLELYPDSVESHYNIGNIYTERGLYEKAIESYKEALKISPYYSKAYYNIGNVYKRLDRFEEAVRNYRLAIKYKPDYLEVYNNLALCYGAMGRNEEAVEAAKKAISIAPDYGLAHSNLAVIYHNMGEYEKAEASYEEARRLGAGNAELEGKIYSRSGVTGDTGAVE